MISENPTNETSSLHQELEVLTVSKRLVRSLSQKLKRKNQSSTPDDVDNTRGVSIKCPTRGGGCKVGATTGDEFSDCRGRPSTSNDYKPVCGPDDTTIDCFSYGVKERFWKRSNNRKITEMENTHQHVLFLPDDIVEMCLVKLPLTSLVRARLVCKKWKVLTSTPRFLEMRRENGYQTPWLFLFGCVKNGICSKEINAFDVSSNKWHKIESEILKGRFMFSVVNIRDDVYIVGGCSSLTNFGRVDRSSVKTHKGVLVFSPLTKSWGKLASMKHARSKPVLGTFEVKSENFIVKSQNNRQERRVLRTRVGGVSDVYEDPHRLSVRRQLRYSLDENEFGKQKNEHMTKKKKDSRRFLIIAVGGVGSWDEPLDSCEIYDSLTNKWTEVQKVPVDSGAVCSGVVCGKMFYVYSETDKLMGYDIEKGYWVGIQTTSLPSRVHEYYPKLVVCGGERLFMVMVSWCEGEGEIGRRNKAVRKVWEVSMHPDAPMDWNAVFVGDGDLVLGVEMFKIFGQVLDFVTVFDVGKRNWVHVSRNEVAHELDAASCVTKSVAVVHL
ncbi:hypothetical protein LXL04_035768 [Taraxacum kok-saghyz]